MVSSLSTDRTRWFKPFTCRSNINIYLVRYSNETFGWDVFNRGYGSCRRTDSSTAPHKGAPARQPTLPGYLRSDTTHAKQSLTTALTTAHPGVSTSYTRRQNAERAGFRGDAGGAGGSAPRQPIHTRLGLPPRRRNRAGKRPAAGDIRE